MSIRCVSFVQSDVNRRAVDQFVGFVLFSLSEIKLWLMDGLDWVG